MNRIKYVDCRRALLLWLLGLAALTLLAFSHATLAGAESGSDTKVAPANGAANGTTVKAVKAGKTVTGIVAVLPAKEPLLATVNGKTITVSELDMMVKAASDKRFYHGQIPAGQAETLRQEVIDSLIERELMVYEAERRGIKPDPGKLDKVLADYDARFRGEPNYQEERDKMLPEMKFQVARHSMVEQLEKAILDVPTPTASEVHAFYEQKPELFTEPEKLHLSVILLSVDPSSSQDVREKALEQARGIRSRILSGADFAAEARLHSSHESAANGGDLGYMHGGMLPDALQSKIDKLQVGELTEPVRVLEGYGLYRVDGRIPGKLQDFSIVEDRASELLERDLAIKAFIDTMERLRASAKIKFFDSANKYTGALPEVSQRQKRLTK